MVSEAAEPVPIPAHSPELHVLSRMFWSEEDARYLADHVDPGHFLAKDRRQLFVELAHAAAKGFTPVTFNAHIAGSRPDLNRLLTQIQGAAGTEAFNDDAPLPALAASLATWAQAEKFRRAIRHASQHLGKGEPPDQVRSTLDRHLLSIDTAAITEKTYDDMADMAARVREHLSGDLPRGLAFGIRMLDKNVVPLLPGNFLLVGGTSGSGKSTVLRNFVRNWMRAGEKVALYSVEMMGDEQLPNFACMETGIDIANYTKNQLTDAERARVLEVVDWIASSGELTINERGSQTPESILRSMKRYCATGHTVFVIDHIHRLTYGEKPGDDIRLHVAAFARALKSFAVDHACIVAAAVQYVKMPPTQEPDDSSIREANNILEEADRVLHIYRPLVVSERDAFGEVFPRLTDTGRRIMADEAKKGELLAQDPTRIYVKIGKQRIRPTGKIVAVPFNAASGLMYEIEERVYTTGVAA